jgi:hypothetical protein
MVHQHAHVAPHQPPVASMVTLQILNPAHALPHPPTDPMQTTLPFPTTIATMANGPYSTTPATTVWGYANHHHHHQQQQQQQKQEQQINNSDDDDDARQLMSMSYELEFSNHYCFFWWVFPFISFLLAKNQLVHTYGRYKSKHSLYLMSVYTISPCLLKF